ncbi:MAG: diacylglycerol kinase, partial [Patescibacteria group bacterium]
MTMDIIKKIVRSSILALRGLRHAYCSDKSFRAEIRYGLPIYLFLGWYLAPFYAWEFLFYVFSYLFILTVELVNTAFEKMLDRIHPEQHDLIGKSK